MITSQRTALFTRQRLTLIKSRTAPRSFVRILAILALLISLEFAPVNAFAAFVIESLDGDITQNEINNFISTIAARNPATNNWGNAMATHGTEPEGMWRMYEATKNISVLNHYIRWMDRFTNRHSGKVMDIGRRAAARAADPRKTPARAAH